MSYINRLEDLPPDYLRLFYNTHVEYISLRNNSLSHIPVTLQILKFLRHLYLEENNIELRNDDFINMTSLKVMYLCSNENSRLQKRFFSGQTNLLKLSVIDRSPLNPTGLEVGHNNIEFLPDMTKCSNLKCCLSGIL